MHVPAPNPLPQSRSKSPAIQEGAAVSRAGTIHLYINGLRGPCVRPGRRQID